MCAFMDEDVLLTTVLLLACCASPSPEALLESLHTFRGCNGLLLASGTSLKPSTTLSLAWAAV